MKSFSFLKILVGSLVVLHVAWIGVSYAAAADKYVLIFTGKPVCKGCGEAVGQVASDLGLPVKYEKDWERIPRLLSNASVFVIGGTNDNVKPFMKLFSPEKIAAVQAYVRNGGRYLGICGGAFMAGASYDLDGLHFKTLNLSPVTVANLDTDYKARLENVRWLGNLRDFYFQSGPVFRLTPTVEKKEIVAQYKNGGIAALQHSYGKGKVFLSGVHVEADQSWLDDDGIKAPHWKATSDLAQAMLKDLLSARLLEK